MPAERRADTVENKTGKVEIDLMVLLRELRATEILSDSLEGGTTRPYVVVGEDGNKYVLKLFGKNHAKQRCYTAAEVCAYLLARKFDLFIPDAVLMTIPQEVLDLVERNNPALHEKLKLKDLSSPSFGSRYLEGLPIYSPAKDDKLLDLEEFESIFAFDTLILNEDRKAIKPNILRGTAHYYLIDHDKAFEGYKIASDRYGNGHLLEFHRNHLFFNRLKKIEKKESGSIGFETFHEYLRKLDLSDIRKQLTRLENLGYVIDDCHNWLNFVEEQKKKSSSFVALLKTHIQL